MTDCWNCKYGERFEDGTYKRPDGTVFIVNGGGHNVKCTKEKISSLRLADDGMVCSDFKERNCASS